jgi:hypothetical protein
MLGHSPAGEWNRLAIEDAQNIVEAHAPSDYYRTMYRPYERLYLPQLVKMVDAMEPGRLIEIGPGNGTFALWAASNGWQVDTVDSMAVGCFITPEFLLKTGFSYNQCNIETEGLPDLEPADLVVMGHVLGHLKYMPIRTLRAIAHKYLKPEGVFLTDNLDEHRQPWITDYAYCRWQDMPTDGPPTEAQNTCPFVEEELAQLLLLVFNRVEVWPDPMFPILWSKASHVRGEC